MSRTTLPSLPAGVVQNVEFDFLSGLPEGVTISGPVATCVVWQGTDASPSTVVAAGPTIVGSVVTQALSPTVVGVIYEITMQVSASNGQTLKQTGYLACTPGNP